jgi:TonB family protein
MRAHDIVGIAALLLASTSAAGQTSNAAGKSVPAVAINNHAVTAEDYPPDSIRLAEQGGTRVRFIISDTGDVTECNVAISSGHSRLDVAACAVVSRWKYRPAMQAGKPVAQNTTANIVFVLPDAPGFTGVLPSPTPDQAASTDPGLDLPNNYVPPADP